MKSVRIESGPSGLIVMSFSSFRLKHGYFFGLVWSCQSYDVFFMVCVWSKGFNERFSLWHQYDFDMFLAYNYLAICFGMIFISFLLGWIDKVIIKSKDDHKVLLVLFHIGLFLEWIVNASKRHRDVYQVLLASVIQNRVMALLGFCLADTKRREHMDARISGSLFTVLLYYGCVLVFCLWRYMELFFWSLWFIDLIIRLFLRLSLVRLCLVAQVYGGDGLIWRIYKVWLLLLLEVCTAFGVLMYAVVFELIIRSSRNTFIKRISFPKLFIVEL